MGVNLQGGPGVYKYSRLSLSRLRLSRITAYLEVKIWSLFKHGNLTTDNKIWWKRGKIAPQKQFLLFSTIFSIYLKLQESNYMFIRFVSIYFFSILKIWYVEVWIYRSISESPLVLEITRVDWLWTPICMMHLIYLHVQSTTLILTFWWINCLSDLLLPDAFHYETFITIL